MSSRVRFGPFEADLRTGELWRDGNRQRLQEQPFQVLVLLLARPGELVTREEIREKLWPADTFVDFDHSLNTAINKLRDVLGDSAAKPEYVETLARRGYRFVGTVTAPAGAESNTPEPEPTVVIRPRGSDDELPQADRNLARGLFALIQLAYLTFYILALWRLDLLYPAHSYLAPAMLRAIEILILVTGTVGLAVRLYWLACVAFDLRRTAQQFLRVFPALVVLDLLWALSPLLAWKDITLGLAFAACAALLFLPFAQRNLVRMAYR
jgi:DNA-binding winged helix-turn-helix (wHTH) protein